MPDYDVIVVGGAVAGSALGNALGQRGVKTLMIEKASREVHSARGDVLQPPTLQVLDAWGILGDFHEDGTQPLLDTVIIHPERGEMARFPIRGNGEGPAGVTVAMPHDRIEATLHAGALRWPTVSERQGTVTGLLRNAAGRVVGVRMREPKSDNEVEITARLVVGADGARSVVRRELGIRAESIPYDQDIIVIAGDGLDEQPNSIRWYFDNEGLLSVVPRPRGGFRFLWMVQGGKAPAVLREADPALHDYLAGRFEDLRPLRFGRADASIYKTAKCVADSFIADGAAIAGDAAHTTNPAGGSGMNLAIVDAETLATEVAPILTAGGSDGELDAALVRYDEVRRPYAHKSISLNDERALAPYKNDAYKDPDAFIGQWSGAQAAGPRPTAPASS